MNLKIYFLIYFILHVSFSIQAQQTGSLNGRVIDAEKKSGIGAATIQISSFTTLTDSAGRFRISNITIGSYQIAASALGYTSSQKFNVVVSSGNENELLFELQPQSTTLNEVTVIGNQSASASTIYTPLSIQKLTSEDIKSNPGGNFDISRVVNTLPGVSSSSGIVSGYRNDIIIRGGGAGENVYYLDGIEIPTINHFATQGSGGGATGILNVSFIDEVKLSSSAFDSRIDNVLSGALEFRQRNGNINKTQGNVRLSGTELAGTLEGPLGKSKKASYLASVRRSYLQALFSLIDLPIRPNYWDFQYKINYQISNKTSVNFLGVGAIDNFGFGTIKSNTQEKIYTLYQVPSNTQRSYTIGTSLRHTTSDGYIFATLSRNVLNNQISKYSNNDDSDAGQLRFSNSGLEIENKARLQWVKNINDWRIDAGSMFQYVQYQIDNNILINPSENQRLITNTAINFFKYGLFAQLSKKFWQEQLSLTFGIRTDGNSFAPSQNFLDGLSPKFTLAYTIAPKWKLNGTIGRYTKLPGYTLLGFKDENGILVNKAAKYIHSSHFVLGTEYLPSSSTRFTFETFYKKYNNLPVSSLSGVNLNNLGADYGLVGNEAALFNGKGESYGFELFAQQKLTNKFFGLLSYTFFYTNYQNADGKWLPGAFDSRHTISTTLGYKFNHNWELGLKMRYQGGAPYTPFDLDASRQSYYFTGRGVLDYTRFNSLRLAAFAGGDFRLTKKWDFKSSTLSLYLDVSNFWKAKTPAYPQYSFERNLQSGEFTTTEGGALKSDGSNAIPIVLDNSDGVVIPTIGFIFEL